MRGDDQLQTGMFSYVSIEERVPQDHPLRAIRRLVDEVLKAMAKEFDGLYSKTGRPSVPPERVGAHEKLTTGAPIELTPPETPFSDWMHHPRQQARGFDVLLGDEGNNIIHAEGVPMLRTACKAR